MKILDDLLSTINNDYKVRDIRQGPYLTSVVSSGCGLATTPHNTSFHHDHFPIQETGMLHKKTAKELAALAYSKKQYEAAIGMAALNSLLDLDKTHFSLINAADLIEENGRGKTVAIVGHFPFVERIRKTAKELHVLDKHPYEGDLDASKAHEVIPQAEVVAITGSAFINHTIEELLGLCQRNTFIIVLGPSTPLSTVLFDYGVHIICGTRVVDSEVVLRYISQGATFRQMKGIELVAIENYTERR